MRKYVRKKAVKTMPDCYSVVELARIMDITQPTVLRFIRNYGFTVNRIGKKIYIPKSEFKRCCELNPDIVSIPDYLISIKDASIMYGKHISTISKLVYRNKVEHQKCGLHDGEYIVRSSIEEYYKRLNKKGDE